MLNSRLYLIVFLTIFFSPTVQLQASEYTVGWLEEVILNETGFAIKAKMDSGADNSSINTVDPVIYRKNNREWIKFNITDEDGSITFIDKPVIKKTRIKNKEGVSEKRYVIEMDICLASVKKTVYVNLVDRSNYKYQVLIGRSFLRPEFLIDSNRTFTVKPDCR